MTTSKPWFQSKPFLSLVLGFSLSGWAWGGMTQGGNDTQTKDLIGASGGVELTGGSVSLSFAAGESIAGAIMSNATESVVSGYYGGYSSAGIGLQLLSSVVGPTTYYQDGVQVGVPLNASVVLTFSNQLTAGTLTLGISATAIMDHLGQSANQQVTLQFSYDPSSTTVVVTPAQNWQGDTYYDLVISQSVQSLSGLTLATPVHVQFITALDPGQENVVLHPIGVTAAGALSPVSSVPGANGLHLDIPTPALSDFSFVLINPDPLHAPRRIDPKIIQDANQKSAAANSDYGTPIAIQEVNGFNLQGGILNKLSQEAVISMSYSASQNQVTGAAATVRPAGLAIWVLDEARHVWIKLPESTVNLQAQTVTAPAARFSVFALMGGLDGNTGDAYVFPIPWRPHGPNAGTGSGQTGTEQAGLTFSGLPSECTIKIYTLSGGLVRTLHHSDLQGQIAEEVWDGQTASSQHVASGVYLWRVESASDGKNGKLMIIR